jgi:hypothetical protein
VCLFVCSKCNIQNSPEFRGALQRVPATAAATELQQHATELQQHPNFRSALQRVPATAAATELQQSCNSMQQSCNSIQILEARFKGFLTRNAKQKF